MVLGSSIGPRPQAKVVGILGAFSGSILSVLHACLSWACVEPSQSPSCAVLLTTAQWARCSCCPAFQGKKLRPRDTKELAQGDAPGKRQMG